MKAASQFLFTFLLAFFFSNISYAQNKQDTIKVDSFKIYKVIKNDGTTFVGRILSKDAREVLIETKETGQVIIPKHEVKEITEIKRGELSASGEYIPAEVFSSRYFITTNGLPIEKGESYIQWNLFGPDFQFGVGKNFGLGIMTSWVGMPVIGSAKYSINLGEERINLGIGTLLGTGSWAAPDFGIALPFGTLTFGDRRKNITFSGGYVAVFYKEFMYDGSSPYDPVERNTSEGRALLSVAGMAKVGKKVSVVFDSFIVPSTGQSGVLALLIPGIRWQVESNRAFQFGFVGLNLDGELVPFPIPMIQWYRKL